MATFNFDERGLQQAVDDAMRKTTDEIQRVLVRLQQQERGKPVETVKATLAREWRRTTGATITDPELSEWAMLLSQGGRVIARYERG